MEPDIWEGREDKVWVWRISRNRLDRGTEIRKKSENLPPSSHEAQAFLFPQCFPWPLCSSCSPVSLISCLFYKAVIDSYLSHISFLL